MEEDTKHLLSRLDVRETAAIREIDADYPRHAKAAGQLAREYFAHDVVLAHLLAEVGL